MLNHQKLGLQTLFGIALLGLGILGLSHPSEAADLRDVRVVKQDTGSQVILDLDAPANDVTINRLAKGYMVSFTGHIAPVLPDRQRDIDGTPALKHVAWNAHGNTITVWFPKTAASGDISVLPLAEPDRLLIRIPERAPAMSNSDTIETVAAGVTHRHIHMTGPRGPLNINILDVDTMRSDITVEPVLASSVDLHGKARVTRMVQAHGAIAGINASYFKPDKGTVLGTVILNRELIAGPLYHRVSLGITSDHRMRMDRLSLRGSLTADNGETIAIDNVNQPRLDKHQALLYSPRWGNLAPPTPVGHVQVAIRNGTVTGVGTQRMSMQGNNSLVLIAPVDSPAGRLVAGNTVSLRLYTVPDWTDVAYAVSGGPYLVHQGQVYVDSKQQYFRGSLLHPAPRTAVGFTTGNHLLMVTVDGRQDKVSTGMTLSEMAALMRRLGAVEAMNFDGGSSTQMVLKGRLVNSPTIAGGAAVSSALLVRAVPLPPNAEVIGAVSNGRDHFGN